MDVVRSLKSMKIKAMKCHGELAGQEWSYSPVRNEIYWSILECELIVTLSLTVGHLTRLAMLN